MDANQAIDKIDELFNEIARLPKGYISKKIINGKTYFYHQWSENNKKKSRYIRDEEIKDLSEQIEKRKRLQKELSSLKKNIETKEYSAEMKSTGEEKKMRYILMK